MNKSSDDRLVDMLLEEWLGGQQPRPVTLHGLEAIEVGHDDEMRLEAALDAAAMDIASAGLTTIPLHGSFELNSSKPLSTTQVLRNRVQRKKQLQKAVQAVAFTLAACFVLALGIWSTTSPLNSKNEPPTNNSVAQAANNALPVNPPIDLEAVRNVGPDVTTNRSVNSLSNQPPVQNEPQKIPTGPKVVEQPERLAMDNVPFGDSKSKKNPPNENKASIAQSDLPSGNTDSLERDIYYVASRDGAVVSGLDKQFQQMWKKARYTPANDIDDNAWLERVSQQILQRPASEDEHQSLLQSAPSRRRMDRLNAILKSDEFNKVWADRIASFYLQEQAPSDTDLPQTEFRGWIRKKLIQGESLTSVVKAMLTAQGSDQPDSSLFNPAAYWWVNTVSGAERSPVSERIFSRLLGETTCNRCHHSDSMTGPSTEQFWGVEAIVKNIAIRKVDRESTSAEGASKSTIEHIVEIRPSAKPVFYELQDAALKTALPMLPSGKRLSVSQEGEDKVVSQLESNIASLADEIINDNRFDRNQVEWIWSSLFGYPLDTARSLEALNESERLEIDARTAVIQSLTDRYRKEGRDIRKLIAWIAMSQVFSREATPSKPTWYLTATEKDLESYRARQCAFAVFPSAVDPSLRSLPALVQWVHKSKSAAAKSDSVLGSLLPQKVPTQKSIQTEKGLAPAVTDGQVQFILRSESLPKHLELELHRIVKSNLKWDDSVAHAFYISGKATPSKETLEWSSKLLETSGDKVSVLRQILTSLY